jgi:hypothetical protein
MNTAPLTAPSSASLFFRRVVLVLLAIWFQLRVHFRALGSSTSSVHHIRLLATPGKANKVEYQIDALRPEEDVPCSLSLLAHAGLRPCWYVARHANDPIAM